MTSVSPANLPHPRNTSASSAGWISIDNSTWETYERLRRETAGQALRITFDKGRMVLMSPLQVHEFVKKVLGRLVEITALERDVPCLPLGSTTWKRQDLAKGLEADECYYVQHEPDVRNLDEIDLSTAPPPDLVIEVDITHQPIDREAIYLAMGVPEVWRYDGQAVTFLHREGNDDQYRPVTRSLALPVLTSDVVNAYLARSSSTPQTELMRSFRDWVRSAT